MTPSLTEPFLFLFTLVQGKTHRLKAMAEVPAALAGIIRAKGAPEQAVAAAHPDIAALSFPGLELSVRAARIEDAVGVTRAVAGIAETGSLVFFSSADTPASLNFVPETQVAILRESEIVPRIEDVWRLLEKRTALPSTVNLITGPSRTGDIEQKLYLGAHGPREVHLLLVTDG